MIKMVCLYPAGPDGDEEPLFTELPRGGLLGIRASGIVHYRKPVCR
jgi:hypothetical protein